MAVFKTSGVALAGRARGSFVAPLIGVYLFGCVPPRDYMAGGGSRAISRPDIVMTNITNQLVKANYNTSASVTNDVFSVVFSKRYVQGRLTIDWSTFRPALNGDLIDHSVDYSLEVSARWFAPSNAMDAVHGVIDRAFELSKGDLYEISRGVR